MAVQRIFWLHGDYQGETKWRQGEGMKKPIKCGLDFLRDAKWNPVVRDRLGAERLGFKMMSADLKVIGFGVSVFDAGDYYRISFGRKY